jgi:hypothetical protein
MATKKNALPFLPATEYDAVPDGTPDISEALRDQRLKKYHANMMDSQDADPNSMDNVNRKDWPEGEVL